MVEHNALVSARYDMTAVEQNIFCMLVRQIKENDPPEKRYLIHLKELEEATGRKIDYIQAGKSAEKLLKCIYAIQENGGVLSVALISDSKYLYGGIVRIGISSTVRPYLFGLKKCFTKYGFHMFMSLKSKYAKRMYKMLSQFKNTGIMRISVEELKHRLQLINPKTGVDKYGPWSTFVKQVLEVSKRELQQHTDISFVYIAKKTGRKFTDLEFKIKHMPEQLILNFDQPFSSI